MISLLPSHTANHKGEKLSSTPFGSAPACKSALTISRRSGMAVSKGEVSQVPKITSSGFSPDSKRALTARKLPCLAAQNSGVMLTYEGASNDTPASTLTFAKCASTLAGNDRAPSKLHTKSLYFLLTFARLRVSNSPSLGSISE